MAVCALLQKSFKLFLPEFFTFSAFLIMPWYTMQPRSSAMIKMTPAKNQYIRSMACLLVVILIVMTSETAMADELSFQQDTDGYTGNVDCQLREFFPDADLSLAPHMSVSFNVHGLTRFNDIFGADPNQIPVGSKITSATLEFTRLNTPGLDQDGLSDLHRMVSDWSDVDTWNTMVTGIQKDGVEATVAASAIAGEATFDVTTDLQAWSTGAPNRGWSIYRSTTSPSDWFVYTGNIGQISNRPVLTVNFTDPDVATKQGIWGSVKSLFR
ncbi:MAG: hypothetical protein ACI9JE_000443 [Candidatus Krumholzibacteriia bacterium]